MIRNSMKVAVIGILLAQSSGETRVDLFGKDGRREGYGVINTPRGVGESGGDRYGSSDRSYDRGSGRTK